MKKQIILFFQIFIVFSGCTQNKFEGEITYSGKIIGVIEDDSIQYLESTNTREDILANFAANSSYNMFDMIATIMYSETWVNKKVNDSLCIYSKELSNEDIVSFSSASKSFKCEEIQTLDSTRLIKGFNCKMRKFPTNSKILYGWFTDEFTVEAGICLPPMMNNEIALNFIYRVDNVLIEFTAENVELKELKNSHFMLPKLIDVKKSDKRKNNDIPPPLLFSE